MPFSETLAPGRVLDHLVGAMAARTATDTIKEWKPGQRVHLGDPFGTVLVWLWQCNRDQAAMFFSGLISQIRKWDADATREITLDILLEGLPLALQGIPETEQDLLIAWLRERVPLYYGVSLADLNDTSPRDRPGR